MDDSRKLHVAMFPWLAFGHMIPFLELAKKIAQKGHFVSFISTPRNIKRLPKIPQHLSPSINFVQLPLPRDETNLPQNAEATIDVPHHLLPFLKKALDGLQKPLSLFLETTTPDWIIYDFATYWLPPIASRLGISQAYFSIFNASSVCFFAPLNSVLLEDYGPRTKPEHFTAPPKWIPFPSKLAFRPFEAKKITDYYAENDSGVSDLFRLKTTIAGSEVCLFRSCKEVEDESLKFLPQLLGKPAIPVGLLPPSAQDSGDDDKDPSWEAIVEWLNKQEKGSVVYVALGSEVQPCQEDITQLALGLEISGLPFFWALRKPNNGSIMLPDGFEDRTRGRGVVWMSWAPQFKTLAHDAIGGFVTHSGWGSIIEAVQFGRPLILLPFLGDQGLNARIFDKEFGMEVPRNEQDGSFTSSSVAELLKTVVVEEKGHVYREKVKEKSEIFKDQNLHDKYIEKLIEYMQMKRS
ncbi:hypothetical protein UlMin_038820 [Ulmus minor]